MTSPWKKRENEEEKRLGTKNGLTSNGGGQYDVVEEKMAGSTVESCCRMRSGLDGCESCC